MTPKVFTAVSLTKGLSSVIRVHNDLIIFGEIKYSPFSFNYSLNSSFKSAWGSINLTKSNSDYYPVIIISCFFVIPSEL